MLRNDKDFQAFEQVMLEAHRHVPMRILSYGLMSTHWHFIVWPRADGELSAFFRRLAHTHAMRWRVTHRTVGDGHLYQGRFKSFAVQTDEHLLTVARYVERSALSAKLVERAEDWRWGSLWTRRHGEPEMRALLVDGPVARPRNWVRLVNQPLTERELSRLKPSLERGRPFGDDRWLARTVKALDLEHTIRREGRPSTKASE